MGFLSRLIRLPIDIVRDVADDIEEVIKGDNKKEDE